MKTLWLAIIARILLVVALLLLLVATVESAPAMQARPVPQVAPESALSTPELVERGDAFRTRKDYAGALAAYNIVRDRTPRDPSLWNRLGITYLQMADYRSAKRHFERSMKLDKTFPEPVNNLGVTCYIQRDYKKAVRYYEKAIALEYTNASFHNNLAAALFALHRYEHAANEYNTAFELDPTIFERTSLGGVVAHLGAPQERGRYAYVLAQLYAKRGDNERALQSLKHAIDLNFAGASNAARDEAFSALWSDTRFQEILAQRANPRS